MRELRRAGERYPGGEAGSGIVSRHAFSFGPHYDPDNLRFGALIACNEERLEPGAGFAEHPHSHTEIVTWVVSGELTHRDSTGHETRVLPGDVQYLSAGAGVRHVERNDGSVPLVFVQMWLAPREPGGEPSYRVLRGADSLPLKAAGAALLVARPSAGERLELPAADLVHAHVVRGVLELGGEQLTAGDSARLAGERGSAARVVEDCEVLLWAMEDQRYVAGGAEGPCRSDT